MNDVFTVFGRGRAKARKVRSRVTRAMRKPGVRSHDFSEHAIQWDGKKNLVGWKLYGRRT